MLVPPASERRLGCDSMDLTGFVLRQLVADAVVLARHRFRSICGTRHRCTWGYVLSPVSRLQELRVLAKLSIA